MSTSGKKNLRSWLSDQALRGQVAKRRRKAQRRAAGFEQAVVVTGEAESLEDRVVLDATLDFHDLKIVAIGGDARFDKQDVSQFPENFSSLGNVNEFTFALKNSGTIYSTTSRVEVFHKETNTKIFTLPDGGQFREFDWGFSYQSSLGNTGTLNSANRYADIVPRFGQVIVDNGIAPGAAFAQRQSYYANGSEYNGGYRLKFGNQTTDELTIGSSAADVQNALMKLSNIGGAGGTASVTSGPSSNGQVSYIVTFGGTLAGNAPLMQFQSNDSFWMRGEVSTVREYAITKRDATADNNGKGMIIPLTGLRKFASVPNDIPTSPFLSAALPSFMKNNYGYWRIPEDRATTFPTDKASLFTPTEFGAYKLPGTNTGFEVRLLGRFAYNAFDASFNDANSTGSKQLGFLNGATGNTSGIRVIKGANGFALVLGDDSTPLTMSPLDKDKAGNPQPYTFRFGGMNFELQNPLTNIRLDRAGNKVQLTNSGEFIKAKAQFNGGALTLNLGGLEIDLTTSRVKASAVNLDVLELGGYRLTAPLKQFFDDDSRNGFEMRYEEAADKFTFTAATGFRHQTYYQDAAVRELQYARLSNAIFLEGDKSQPNPANLSVTGGTLTLTKGVLDPNSTLNLRHVEINRRTTINGQQNDSRQVISAADTGLKAVFRADAILNDNKTVRVPANSLLVFGQSNGLVRVDGFEVGGKVDFGNAPTGQFQIANSQFVSLAGTPTEIIVGGVKFKPEAVGSSPAMTVQYTVPVGNESASWNFTGGASLVSGSPSLPAGMKVAFGGSSTTGLQVFSTENRVTGGGAVVGSFKAGTSSLVSSPGLDGTRLVFNSATKKLEIAGKALLAVNGFDATLLEHSILRGPMDINAWQFLESPNERFVARVEPSAGTSLVFRVLDKSRNFESVWDAGGLGNYVSMQADGNLVRKGFLGDSGISNTGGNPGAYLAMFNDGNLGVVSADGRLLWDNGVHIQDPAGPRPPGLRVNFTAPTGVTGVNPNRLDGDVVNMFVVEKVSLNSLAMTPLPTSNALRVEARNGSSMFTGDLSALIGGRNFYATANPINFGEGAIPGSGLTLDFTKIPNAASDWAVGGVVMTGLRTATFSDNNTKLSMNYPKAVFEKQTMAEGTNPEPSKIVLVKGKLSSADIVSAGSVKVGDFEFSNYKANYNFNTTPAAWNFNGPAKFFGKTVNVGGGGSEPNLKIGGDPKDPKRGPQILPSNLPYDVGPLSFPRPAVVVINGVNFETSKFTEDKVETDGDPGQAPRSKTYSISTKEYTVKLGQTSITFSGAMRIKVFKDPNDGNKATYEIAGFEANIKQDSPITIGNATIQVKALQLFYDIQDKQLEISGTAAFKYMAGGNSADMEVTLGNKDKPGLVIRDGAVQSLVMSVTGSFQILKLNIQADGLTLEYQKEEQQFIIYGSIILNTAKTGSTQLIKDMKIKLGSSTDKPGIVIASGSLKSLDISLSGDVNLFGITASANKLRVRYSADTNVLQITGGVSVTLASGLTLKASLPGEGILINTQTGEVQIRGIKLAAEGEIEFGVLKIRNLEGFFEDDGKGNLSFGAAATIALPSGLEVGGSFKVINGTLDSIGVKFQRNPGILVANGIINIYSIEGKIEGLSDLNNFKLSATVRASVGPKVAFAGKSFALADVFGTVTVTKDDLTIEGGVDLVGGLFGKGRFKGTLTWTGTPRVTFSAEIRLYPGDIIRGTIRAYIDTDGNVDFDAKIGVYVPNQIPVAGGWSLGEIEISLRIRPSQPPANSYVSFRVRILNVSGGIKASFDANVHFDLEIDFFFFSISKSGDFSLRDFSDRPEVQIVSAASVPGSPDGRIVFKSTDGETSGQVVDLYVDTDAVGNDGVLIGSGLVANATDTTFIWQDMSTFAKPGQPIYVYAVVRDAQNQQTFSDYSLPFTVGSNYLPVITSPTMAGFEAGRITTFSVANGNSIMIDDPRKRYYANSELLVALDTGAGTLDFASVPANVEITGAGTRHMTLRGTQDAINAALNGLQYVARENAMFDDAIRVSVDALPLENLDLTVTKSIAMNLNPVTLSTISHQDSDVTPYSFVMTGDTGATPLSLIDIDSRTSDFLTGARIQIENFVPGEDFLQFSFNSELETGIEAEFDAENGVLILAGYESVETYEAALQNVVFSTSTVSTNKSLTVAVLDDDGERGSMNVPLTIRKSHDAPQVYSDDWGILYTQDQDAVYVAPSAELSVYDGRELIEVTVAFTPDSYTAGEDVLNYVNGMGPITGTFNAETGVLTLTGDGTTAEYSEALRNVFYESLGATFTPGTRYITITATDSDLENNSGEAMQVIQKFLRSTVVNAPQLALSVELLELQAADEFVLLDENLTLTADLERLTEARVAIVDGYCAGEQYLTPGLLWDGMDANFDDLTGELIIRGVATVEEYESVLRSIVFVNTAADRTCNALSVSYYVTDGVTDPAYAGLSVYVADAPHLDTVLNNVLVYEDGRQSLVIDTGMTIDYEGTLTGATVTIVGGNQFDEDRLAFWNQNGITGVYRPRLGVLELTGTASVADYAAALASIKYYNTRYNPSSGERILEYQVRNGAVVSNTVSALISVEPDLLSPRITPGSGGIVFVEDGMAVHIAPGFDLTAMDATDTFSSAPSILRGIDVAILNYVQGEDFLVFTDTATINGEWNDEEGRLFLFGDASFADYEAAVRSITYSNTSDSPNTDTRNIRIALLDNGENGMIRNAVTTQVVRTVSENPVKNGGDTTPVYVVQNGEPTELGLEDLTYRAPATFTESDVECIVRVTQVTDELLGAILRADGSVVEVGDELPLAELATLKFEPALGGIGTGYFKFEVHLSDPDSGKLDNGYVAESVAIVVTGATTTTASEAFVAQVFRDLMGRDAGRAIVQTWAATLNRQLQLAGNDPEAIDDARHTVVGWISRSNTVRSTQVQSVYRDLLDREPTSGELATALSSIVAGGTLNDVRLSLASSDEFFTLRGGSNAAYVDAMFDLLRGEVGGTEETARWIVALDRGDSRLSVATGIADYDDALEREANDLFNALLGRDLQFDDVERFDFDSVASLMMQIMASDEYFGRNAVPTSATLTRTHVTNQYTAVGRIGDIAGDKATGTLIAPQYVLVAAHSVAGLPPGQLTFTLNGVTHRVTKIAMHPDYEADLVGTNQSNDIAILKLSAPVTGVTPAVLSTVGVTEGDVLNLVGYGQHNGAEFGTKRTGSTPAVQNVDSRTFSWTVHTAWENDSDPGDSGAPLFLTHNGVEYVAGIVTGGTHSEDGYGDTSLNTRVDAYIDWINRIAGLNLGASVSVFADAASIVEGSTGTTPVTFTVTRTGRIDIPATVSYAVGGAGVNAADFGGTLPSGTVSFISGEVEKTITIRVTADSRWELPEVFTVTLTNPSAGITIADPVAQTTISNDDLDDVVYSAVGGQVVNVSVTNGLLNVVIGGVVQPVLPAVSMKSLTINGGSAADTINLTGLSTDAYSNLRTINLNGNAGKDTITGSPGFSENISGGADNDTLNGGVGGNDRLVDSAPAELESPFSATLNDNRLTGTNGTDTHSNFEEAALTGGAFNDLLDASAFSGRAILSGLAGNDILNSGRGDDLLFGGADNDVLNGGRGNDILSGGDGIDQLNGGDGHDVLIGGYAVDTLRGGVGQDLLIGGALTADLNTQAALTAIQAEWTSNKTLAVRRTNLKNGGGLNGTRRLTSATIQNDGANDSLGGGTDADWFLQSSGDSLFDHSAALGDVLDLV